MSTPLDELRGRLYAAWPNGSPHGQCAVTALVIQDVFGGDLLRGLVYGIPHYWNRLPDGVEVDITREQFPVFSVVDVVVRSREYVLSFPDTAARYRALRKAVLGE